MTTVTDVERAVDDRPPAAPRRSAQIWIVTASALVGAAILLEAAAGEPPSTSPGLIDWMEDNRAALIVLDEVLVFAALALGAAAFSARRAIGQQMSERMVAAHGLVGLTAVMMFVTSLAGGRFVYPVHDISVEDENSAALVAGLFFGGQHMVWLLLGGVTLAIAAGARRVSSAGFRWASVAVALCAIAGSYPDVLGPVATVIVRMTFVIWLGGLAAAIPRPQTGPSARR